MSTYMCLWQQLAARALKCGFVRKATPASPTAAPHTYELELWLISEQNTRLQRAGLPG